MKYFLYPFVAFIILLFGCSTTDEQCVDLDKISEYTLGELVGKELNKIYFDEEHFHRRTGEPEDYDVIIDLNDENTNQ